MLSISVARSVRCRILRSVISHLANTSGYVRCREKNSGGHFFHCWTRKEAYLKAVGAGLTQSLKNFEVSLGDEAKLVWIKEGDTGDWTLRHIETRKGLCRRGSDCGERC